MPADSGMAFVLVQHLPPDRESMLVELLARHTQMPVRQVEDGMAVEKDHVYIIRPGHNLTIRDGHLHLGEVLGAPGNRRPIDDFFRSLAEEQRERAIGVILSGMGSNGTAGCQEIKAVGGVTVAQDPESAKFPSMPRSLMDSNLADFILRPGEMPEVLARYAKHPYARKHRGAENPDRAELRALHDILAVLRTRARHDFSGYKRPTLVRRIQRRMGLNQFERMSDYAKSLRQSATEVQALADDLQIHVTGFFRDEEAWEALRERVIEPLVAGREEGGSIRAWITACSSGEEAYTLGILLLEAADRVGKSFDIKIFATDTAERSLSHARAGLFPGGIETEMSPERLDRWFDADDSSYRVKQELRELVVFAPQNVLQDPPFSRLDIATCRNLLIYLEPDVQKRVLSLLHFGLREDGALLLGTSETVGSLDALFKPIDPRWRLYRRVGPTRHGLVDFPLPRTLRPDGNRTDNGELGSNGLPRLPSRASAGQLVHRALLDRHTPAAVAVDRAGSVVYFHGRTSQFLDQPAGDPTRELLALTRDEVRSAVRTALQRASDGGTNRATVADGMLDVGTGGGGGGGGRQRVVVHVEPLQEQRDSELLLVSFELRPEPVSADADAGPGDGSGKEQLAGELARVRDELQSTIEELQTSNEELKASNEEVTSVNEELQSTNEELETSKEELQSLNEELSTVNSQLQGKMEELERTTNDLSSLLSSTSIAVIFLDTGFRIRRFTPATKDLFELRQGDVGRPLEDFNRKFEDPDLLADARSVRERLVPIEREVASESGLHYLRRILPYRTADDRIDGVVVTFIDISERRAAEASTRRLDARFRALADIVPDLLWHSDPAGVTDWFNQRWIDYTGQTLVQAQGFGWLDAIHVDDREACRRAFQDAADRGGDLRHERRIRGRDGEYRWFLAQARALYDDGGAITSWFGAATDVHDYRITLDALRKSEQRLRVAAAAAKMGFWEWDVSTDHARWDRRHNELFGLPLEQRDGTIEQLMRHIHADDRDRVATALREAVENQTDYVAELRAVHPDGAVRWIAGYGRLAEDDGTRPRRMIGGVLDITARKEAEQERAGLLEGERSARRAAEVANDAKDDFLANVSHELRTPLSAILLWSKMLLRAAEGERRAGDEQLYEGLDAIERSARAQQTLIDDLLDTTRIAAGKLRLELQTVELAPLMRNAIDSARPTAQAKSITVETDVGKRLGRVVVDPDRIQQVVWNLLNNAVKFTPAGGTITVSAKRLDGEVELRVVDTGRGISKEFLPQMFRRFEQATEAAEGGVKSGLGLGLPICRQLVELHGGSIDAESDGLGKGATFTVLLPLPKLKQAGATADETPADHARLDGARILLVEDTPDVREALAAVLRNAGAIVAVVEDATAALAAMKASRFDLLVSDIGLGGGVDGNELLRRVRTRESDAGEPPRAGGGHQRLRPRRRSTKVARERV